MHPIPPDDTATETPTAEQATQRLRADLAKGLFADPERAALLQLVSARRSVRGEFLLTTTVAKRRVVTVEEPFRHLPEPLPPIALWEPAWPPSASVPLQTSKIDVLDNYEVLACPACGHVGETRCAMCLGSGKVRVAEESSQSNACPTCKGTGSVTCRRCEGQGQIMHFPRIHQDVHTSHARLRVPEQDSEVPQGAASGDLHVDQLLGFNDGAAALAALRQSAPAADADWLSPLAEALAAEPDACRPPDCRLGRRSLRGRWYNGWELRCRSGDSENTYFVADTAARPVGHRLRSTRKVTAGAVVLGVLVMAVGGWAVAAAGRSRAERQMQAATSTASTAAMATQAQDALLSYRATETAAIATQAESERQKQNVTATASALASLRAATAKAQAEAELQERLRAETIQRAEQTASALEQERAALTSDLGALQALVRNRRWDEAETAANTLERRLDPALVPDSPIREAAWVVDLQARLASERAAIQEEKDRKEASTAATREHERAAAARAACPLVTAAFVSEVLLVALDPGIEIEDVRAVPVRLPNSTGIGEWYLVGGQLVESGTGDDVGFAAWATSIDPGGSEGYSGLVFAAEAMAEAFGDFPLLAWDLQPERADMKRLERCSASR